jgi:hypothetical protein
VGDFVLVGTSNQLSRHRPDWLIIPAQAGSAFSAAEWLVILFLNVIPAKAGIQ